MRSSGVLYWAAILVATAAVAGYYISTLNRDPGGTEIAAPVAIEAERPRLEISVTGEANGTIVIELFSDVAPRHVERIASLAETGAYDDVVFHRVIDGFMAQTGDVQFGKADGDASRAGQGGSDMDDLAAEFSELSFQRGMVGMARSSNPNSANSQFFIMFAPAPHLDGQYTIVGQIVEGLDILDAIKLGAGPNGAMVGAPDVMTRVRIIE